MIWLYVILGVLLLPLLPLLAFVLFKYARVRSKSPRPAYKDAPHRPTPLEWSDDEVTMCWIGHSTLLINLYGFKILTDPVFAKRVGVKVVGPVQVGPKRHTGAALTLEELGRIDLVLLSHAHLDHFDMPTLKQLAGPDVQVVTATGTSHLLRRYMFSHVHELGAPDKLQFGDVTITAVPVNHWGQRFPWNKGYGWTGYLIERRGVRLFFPGDTAYTPTFTRLSEEYGPIDVTFMPIGAYSPDAFLRNHCTPEQAWAMYKDTGARWLVPIHWDTFVLSHEPVEEPLERLLDAAGEEEDRIVVRQHGETFVLPR